MKNPYKEFDEYGLRHLPRHLIDLEQWDTLEEFLTDLHFIEAKCATGMIYDLIDDYNDALDVLPEAQEENRQKREHEARVQKYISDLIAYAKGEIKELEIIESVKPWSEEKIKADIERIKNNPTRLDRIRAFAQFVDAESHALLKFAAHSGFCIQQAYNFANAGPVASAAEAIVNTVNNVLLLQRPSTRPEYNPYPELLRTFEGYSEEGAGKRSPDDITYVSITPDGRRAVAGGGIWHQVWVWDLEHGGCVYTLTGHTDRITCVSITPDGRYAVSGSKDKTLRVWNLEQGVCLHTLVGHTGEVTSVSITPDGRRAASGGWDWTVRVWDVEHEVCLNTFEGHTRPVTCVNMTPDSRLVVSGSREFIGSQDRGEWMWDSIVRLANEDTCVSGPSDDQHAMSENGELVGMDKFVRVWDLEQGVCLHTLEGHTMPITSVSITPDGRRAVSGSYDKTVRVWDVERGDYLYLYQQCMTGYMEVNELKNSLLLSLLRYSIFTLISGGILELRWRIFELSFAQLWEFFIMKTNTLDLDGILFPMLFLFFIICCLRAVGCGISGIFIAIVQTIKDGRAKKM